MFVGLVVFFLLYCLLRANHLQLVFAIISSLNWTIKLPMLGSCLHIYIQCDM